MSAACSCRCRCASGVEDLVAEPAVGVSEAEASAHPDGPVFDD